MNISIVRYHIRAHTDPHGRLVDHAGFEAAAASFVEDHPCGGDESVRLVVCDIESGEERCFVVDLTGGVS